MSGGVPTESAELRLVISMPDAVRCGGCVERVRAQVAELSGVTSVLVDATAPTITLAYDPNVITATTLEAAVRALGLEGGDAVAHASYRLTGLD